MHFHRDVLAIADTFSRHVLKPHRRRPVHRHAAAGLHVRPRRPGGVPAAGRRRIAAAREGHARRSCRPRSPSTGPTVLFTAPTAYRAMLAGAASADASASLRRCVSAGEPLPRRPGRRSATPPASSIIDGIGATEMLHIFISAADDDIRPGVDRPAGARVRGRGPRRRRPAGARRRARPARGAGPDRLPLPRRRAAAASTCSTAGTSPATRTCGTRTATSGTRPAATT